jgi:hypothetical protein
MINRWVTRFCFVAEVGLNILMATLLLVAADLLGIFLARSGSTPFHRLAFGSGLASLCGLLGVFLVMLKVGAGFFVFDWKSWDGMLLAAGLFVAVGGAMVSAAMGMLVLRSRRGSGSSSP